MSQVNNNFWSNWGSPVHIASPMVDGSELAFRKLMRNYDAHLCYTPMLHARMFVNDLTYRRQRYDCMCDEGPIIAQFAGDDPQTLLSAAQVVEHDVSGVDLNCGCPQPIARKGHYGSALLREADIICEIMRTWSNSLTCSVSCKIRILDEGSTDPSKNGLQATIRLVQEVEAAGAHFITVHGRTRHMSGKHTGFADWQAIAAIKARVSIPVIANGNIECFEDVTRCRAETGCDGVMSAEALLEYPALFSGKKNVSPMQLAREYLDIVRLHPPHDFNKITKAHVLRMVYGPLTLLTKQGVTAPDLSTEFAACKTVDDLLCALSALETTIRDYCTQRRMKVLSGLPDSTALSLFDLHMLRKRTALPSNNELLCSHRNNDYGNIDNNERSNDDNNSYGDFYSSDNNNNGGSGVEGEEDDGVFNLFDDSGGGDSENNAPCDTTSGVPSDRLQGSSEPEQQLTFNSHRINNYHNSSSWSDYSAAVAVYSPESGCFDCSQDVDHYLSFCADQHFSWYRRHRVGVIDIDRESRKEKQQMWIEHGLRFTR